MSSRSSKHQDSGSKKHSSKKAKSKTEDWTDVTEPEERRRIQNRIAQRKFREKAKEQKEKAERDSRNQENAGSSYHIPNADDLGNEDGDPTGLPWGSISMRHVVARGHESEGRRSSGRDDYTQDGAQYYSSYYAHQQPQTAGSYGSHDSSGGGGDDQYYDDHQQQQQQHPHHHHHHHHHHHQQSSSYYYDYGTGGGDGSSSQQA
ncbi:hypothetical protein F4809DRAFT_650564 [Biscogniauxia mediterranea]|nr:hypothetical protein F4809DRAFT_650564 [Biscogniauxia mediterranea]